MDSANREKLQRMMKEFKDKTASLDVLASQPFIKLRYTIAEASSYSGIYEPHNILYDRPHDLASRWSGAAVASIAPNSSSSNASNSGGSNPPSSSVQRSSSPLGGTRDGGVAAATSTMGGAVIGRSINGKTTTGGAGHFSGDKQFIILKLDKPSILRKIHFGKYHKPHPCNLKDFKVYGSQSTKDSRSNSWVRILRGGLRNDSQSEAFDVRWTNSEGVPFPIRYIKLIPLATHQPNFNFSVWHISLEGVSDRYAVDRITNEYQDHRESTAIRLILKHLRSRAYHSAFRSLLQSCKLDGSQGELDEDSWTLPSVKRPLEHPLVTQLFNYLMQGAWDAAEECLEKAAWIDSPTGEEDETIGGTRQSVFSESNSSINSAVSLFSSYVDRSMPKASWNQIFATDNNGDSPCGRGGHEMELDSEKGIIWLFGGWDGSKDLSDLWAYYIQEAKWRCISRDVRYQGGPGPRSCHKMVFDPRTGFLYVLGKFVEYDKAPSGGTANTGRSQGLSVSSPTLTQRGSSPIDRLSPSANQPASANRSATRGFFLPRVAATQEGSSQTGVAENSSADFIEEMFGSTRGGSTRLSSGRTSFLAVDRATRGDNPGSGATSSNPGSPNPSGQSNSSMTGYESDFYRFSTRTERWDRLSFDTHSESGPKLIFDHQMIIDPDTQLLYVFGGRVAHPDSSKVELSGMWKYDVIQRSWTFLFDDLTHAQSRVPSRVGHTMLLDTFKKGHLSGNKLIWVLAGQRNNQYLADMWTYQPATGVVREISKDYSASNGPEGGFTQRAAIDSSARELYLFSGLVKKSKNKEEQVKSAFWIYSIERGDWRMVYQYGGLGSLVKREGSGEEGEEEVEGANGDEDVSMEVVEPRGGPLHAFPTNEADLGTPLSGERVGSESNQGSMSEIGSTSKGRSHATGMTSEPQPRYAAQLMYDFKRKMFYIFGGNPADAHRSSLRLDDLWSLELVRPDIAEVLRKAKFKLRQQRYLELTQEQNEASRGVGAGLLGAGWGAMQALVYLQTQVSQVVNHDIAEESQAFRKLMAHLLSASSTGFGNTIEAMSPGASNSDIGFSSTLLSVPTSLPISSGDEKDEGKPLSAVSSDSGEEEESEMLSISQVLPTNSKSELNLGGPLLLDQSSLGSEGKASPLYKQRYQLFKSLLQFFPTEAIEPEVDLLDCIEISKLSF